jgi:caffeoyl-CoA O-methyltransferase
LPLTLVPEEIETYAQKHSEPENALLKELNEETQRSMKDPQMVVGSLEGAVLRLLVRLTRAKRILEIGMFTGYSALSMAAVLPADGELITCDVDPKAEAVARRYFERTPDGSKIKIRMGPALETLKTLTGPFDLVFIDADKENYEGYYENVLPLVRQGGLIVADNTLWSGKVLAPTHASDVAIVAFNEKVAQDPRVEKVLLTVRDGMTLLWKR